ncbi:acyltransferase [Streptomyces sp. NPDC050560]|uniref:acyltransferase n=1 Tax=Streptomyces sp. NPDC050560 TaxID=3365630 RepID=UPI0037BAAFFC
MSTENASAHPATPRETVPAPRPPADAAPATAAVTAVQTEAPAAAAATPAKQDRPRREHRYDIDLLRIICAFCIILGHVGGECMLAVDKSEQNGKAVYWTGLFLDSVTSWAVPLYFAIAGWAVLVGAPPRDGRTLRKRSLRMIVPVGIWSAVYLAWGWVRDTNGHPTPKLALDAVFGTVQPAYHLWYFYAHVPLILILGFVMLLKAGRRPWGVVAALVVLGAGPTATGDLASVTGWDVPHFGWGAGTYSMVYAVVGALLLSLPPTPRGHRRWWVLGAVVSLALILWSQHTIHFVIPNASIFVGALAACVLMSLNGLRIPERIRPRLTLVMDAGLGAFMVHVLLLKTISPSFMDGGRGWLGSAVAAAALTVATAVPSFAVSMLWGKLKLRRYLG